MTQAKSQRFAVMLKMLHADPDLVNANPRQRWTALHQAAWALIVVKPGLAGVMSLAILNCII
jgi:hypothetical protein